MSRKSTRQTSNPKNYPEGSLARKLSHNERRARVRRGVNALKFTGAVAAATTVAVLGADKWSDMDRNHKQSVAVEAAQDALNDGRANRIDVNTNVYLREGVVVRTEPKVNEATDNHRGNELHTVDEGEVLVISNPITVENEDGGTFLMFTLEDGRVGYTSKDVLGQEDEDGNRYGIIAPEQQPTLPEGLSTGSLEFNENSGVFTIDGNIVSSARTMTPEQAFEDLA